MCGLPLLKEDLWSILHQAMQNSIVALASLLNNQNKYLRNQ